MRVYRPMDPRQLVLGLTLPVLNPINHWVKAKGRLERGVGCQKRADHTTRLSYYPILPIPSAMCLEVFPSQAQAHCVPGGTPLWGTVCA